MLRERFSRVVLKCSVSVVDSILKEEEFINSVIVVKNMEFTLNYLS